MTISSEKPTSNMHCGALKKTSGTHPLVSDDSRSRGRQTFSFFASPSMVWPTFSDRRSARLVGRAFLHAFLETLDRAAEILTDVAQLLGAEDQHDDHQNDQPVPDAE